MSTGFETQTQNDERPVRGQTLHENRERDRGEGQGEVPRTVETWYVSRHDDPRTEVWRGCTPKVSKL